MTAFELMMLLLSPLLLSIVLGRGDIHTITRTIQRTQQISHIAKIRILLFLLAGMTCLLLVVVETTPYGVVQAQFGSIMCFASAGFLWLFRAQP